MLRVTQLTGFGAKAGAAAVPDPVVVTYTSSQSIVPNTEAPGCVAARFDVYASGARGSTSLAGGGGGGGVFASCLWIFGAGENTLPMDLVLGAPATTTPTYTYVLCDEVTYFGFVALGGTGPGTGSTGAPAETTGGLDGYSGTGTITDEVVHSGGAGGNGISTTGGGGGGAGGPSANGGNGANAGAGGSGGGGIAGNGGAAQTAGGTYGGGGGGASLGSPGAGGASAIRITYYFGVP